MTEQNEEQWEAGFDDDRLYRGSVSYRVLHPDNDHLADYLNDLESAMAAETKAREDAEAKLAAWLPNREVAYQKHVADLEAKLAAAEARAVLADEAEKREAEAWRTYYRSDAAFRQRIREFEEDSRRLEVAANAGRKATSKAALADEMAEDLRATLRPDDPLCYWLARYDALTPQPQEGQG